MLDADVGADLTFTAATARRRSSRQQELTAIDVAQREAEARRTTAPDEALAALRVLRSQ